MNLCIARMSHTQYFDSQVKTCQWRIWLRSFTVESVSFIASDYQYQIDANFKFTGLEMQFL